MHHSISWIIIIGIIAVASFLLMLLIRKWHKADEKYYAAQIDYNDTLAKMLKEVIGDIKDLKDI